MLKVYVGLACLVVCLMLPGMAWADINLVQNPGFETSDLTGWTLLNGSGMCIAVASGGGFFGCQPPPPPMIAPRGNYSLYDGPYGDTRSVTQDVATLPGVGYNVGFWLANAPANPDHPESVRFIDITFGATNLVSLANQAAYFDWIHYTFHDVVAAAASTTLSFGPGENDWSYWVIDDVSVTAVPEPAAVFFTGTMLLGLAGALKRKWA